MVIKLHRVVLTDKDKMESLGIRIQNWAKDDRIEKIILINNWIHVIWKKPNKREI